MQASTDETIAVAREDIPLAIVRLLAGQHEKSARQPGLITREDIIRIKLYVKNALSLPLGEYEVRAYIGYTKAGIEGLEPSDIAALFESILLHAIKWPEHQYMLMVQSNDIEVAARKLTNTGRSVIDVIQQMPILHQVQPLGEFAGKQLDGIRYSDADGRIADEVGKILVRMKDDIAQYRDRTAKVKVRISDFKTELAGGRLSSGVVVPGLEPTVKSKRDLMRRSGLTAEISSLQQEIDRKEERVEELKRDYGKYVGLCFVPPTIVMATIFGSKAEEARKAKNDLLDEIDALRKQMGGKRALQEALEKLSHMFHDIGTRMVDAETALLNLEAVWEQLLAEIETSRERFASIDEAESLILFVADFEKVITPWSIVQGLSGDLVSAINDGLNEYKRLYEK